MSLIPVVDRDMCDEFYNRVVQLPKYLKSRAYPSISSFFRLLIVTDKLRITKDHP